MKLLRTIDLPVAEHHPTRAGARLLASKASYELFLAYLACLALVIPVSIYSGTVDALPGIRLQGTSVKFDVTAPADNQAVVGVQEQLHTLVRIRVLFMMDAQCPSITFAEFTGTPSIYHQTAGKPYPAQRQTPAGLQSIGLDVTDPSCTTSNTPALWRAIFATTSLDVATFSHKCLAANQALPVLIVSRSIHGIILAHLVGRVTGPTAKLAFEPCSMVEPPATLRTDAIRYQIPLDPSLVTPCTEPSTKGDDTLATVLAVSFHSCNLLVIGYQNTGLKRLCRGDYSPSETGA